MTPLLLATLLAAATPPAASTLAAQLQAKPDPCDGLALLPGDEESAPVPLHSPRQRARLACQLREAIAGRYVFFAVKGELLSRRRKHFDPAAHLDACVERERSIPYEADPLAFYDRMRACTAAFEDGHLVVSAPSRLPQVALGITLRLAEGRVFVASRERKLVSYLSATSGIRDLDGALATGNEVLEIDGRPAVEQLRALTPYLPASSDAARLERAVDALTRRDFAYPSKPAMTLTVMADGVRRSLELPWWIAPGALHHPLTRAYEERVKLSTTELLTWRYDAGRDAWAKEAPASSGYERTGTILPARDEAALAELYDEYDRPAVRMGEVVRRRDRAYCYLQILTFQTETLSRHGESRPFLMPIESFLRGCKEKELDLVLDLRQNGGGFLSHTSGLFAMLGEPEKSYPGGALVVRATTMNQLIYRQRSPAGPAPARAADAMDPRHIAEAIAVAERSRADFTPAFLEAPIHASEGVGGFPEKVVALVAPTCMSACDRLAALLQRSGRATLVGSPTEGAGGSQQETHSLPVRWTDPQGLVSLSLPNAAMGVQSALPSASAARAGVVLASLGEGAGAAHVRSDSDDSPTILQGEAPASEFFQSLTFENRPIAPDVAYATRADDLTHENRGWRAEAEAALFARRAPSAGAVAAKPVTTAAN